MVPRKGSQILLVKYIDIREKETEVIIIFREEYQRRGCYPLKTIQEFPQNPFKSVAESSATQSWAKNDQRVLDGRPRGPAVPGVLQARTLEWVAISSSHAVHHILAPCTIHCCNLVVSGNISPVRLSSSLVLKPDLINLFINYVLNTSEV